MNFVIFGRQRGPGIPGRRLFLTLSRACLFAGRPTNVPLTDLATYAPIGFMSKRIFPSTTRAVLLVAAIFISGCAGPARLAPADPTPPAPPQVTEAARPAGALETVAPPADVVETLYSEIDSWLGTPHRMGGTDRSGADCSGFLMTLFDEAFAVRLPRTTSEQVRVGSQVSRSARVPGDLIFFRPPKNQHVGVYLGEGRFVHASSSRGVMISNVDEAYWQRYYWMSRRVLQSAPATGNAGSVEMAKQPSKEVRPPAPSPPSPPRRRGGW
jgi:cell wall-associated NlpC family hydrolase